MPSAPATSPKGRSGAGEVGTCGEVSCFKFVWDQVWGGEFCALPY